MTGRKLIFINWDSEDIMNKIMNEKLTSGDYVINMAVEKSGIILLVEQYDE